MDMEARRKLILKAFGDHSTLDGMAEEVALAWEEDASEAFNRGVAVGAESVQTEPHWLHELAGLEVSMTWKDDLKRAMIDALVKLGSPMRDKPDIYGWEDYDWQSAYEGRPHPKRVMIEQAGIDYAATTYVEDDWYEFAGTFCENDHVYGVALRLVLLDGMRLNWRYGGNLSELINEVLKD